METSPREVLIDGERYVRAVEIAPALDDFRNALLDLFYGENYRGLNPERAGENLVIRVYDDGDGEPLQQFLDDLTAKLTAKKPNP